ncbi:TPA: GTP 3',8-cyclase MoaA [Candidatus Poribacteria bacterium]|nr:GTP 3',8-cyclase MoaA [Candidatus Poribacteria bacterium]HIA69714.1 GTP 3',8-cyclase MoaA [Candidatus Poribacteria bacterium]HIB86840.1 GTP 3',8-cyclase MoaA [Candidatus Poribacteria bacterium]HIC02227.1 GTP 3',8-cyclase MoaA [Candidatus Poribacteria bacterium]HIM11395.1 GTP 3',8-cyclase MoaA [Candidatus Poribacteria bacterium]
MGQGHLVDRFNRIATNLRVSVTDVCNLRCTYCMSEDMQFIDKSKIMTFDEIDQLIRIAVGLGVNKVRITGGEPLVRPNLSDLILRVLEIDGIKDVSLTTNGIGLAKQAQALYDAGLRRINVSLDALSEAKFEQITRRKALTKVLEGLKEANRCGFNPIKINAVTMRGFTEEEVVKLVSFARKNSYEMRFIEFMPLDADDIWGRNMFVPKKELVDKISELYPLEPIESSSTLKHETAKNYQFKDGIGRVGFISSVSEPFCDDCNRVRLTADGKFRNCLFATEETDLLTPLRKGASDEVIADMMIESVAKKKAGHLINSVDFIKPKRNMSMIGG